MTSTLNAASTDRMLRRFATRRPEWFAVLTSAAYSLPLLALALLGHEQFASTTASPVLLAANAWCVLVPAVLLTVLGWWGTAGFTRRSTWRSLVPFLPLILLYVGLPALSLVSAGVASHSSGYLILAAVTVLAVGFGEEATFRGVVLQTLLHRGVMRAVLLSSVLYAAPIIGILALDRYRDPVLVGGRVLIAVGIGVAFAAVVVVTGTIWPLVVVSASHLFIATILVGDNPAEATDFGNLVGGLIMGALAAAYGIWLLHRHKHRLADHSGEEDQASAREEPPAA